MDNLYEAVKLLAGHITPSGNAAEDEQRLINLESLAIMLHSLIADVRDAALAARLPGAAPQDVSCVALRLLQDIAKQVVDALGDIIQPNSDP